MIFDVIIIGSGIAGLAAAKELYDNNVKNFLILEAKDKIGGRISTVEFGKSVVELGAQFIHGEQNSLYEIVNNADHIHPQKSWEAKGQFYMPNGHCIPEKFIPTLSSEVTDILEANNFEIENTNGVKLENASIGTYLEMKFREKCLELENGINSESVYRDALFRWAKLFQEIDNSCSTLNDLSLYRWSDFIVNPGHWQNNFRYGASAFLEHYFSDILKPRFIKFLCPVEKILWSKNDIVEIILQNGEIFYSKTIICTIPIGVLKQEIQRMFIPSLPEITAEAIFSTGFGSITKIFLEWEIPWWMEEHKDTDEMFYGIQIVWPIEKLSNENSDNFPPWTKGITGFDPVLNNPNVLLAWVGGEYSSIVEQLEDIEVSLICQQVLAFFLGHDVPMPQNCLLSKWASDPFTRGSYSYRSVQGDHIPGDISAILSEPIFTMDESNMHDKKPTILFAGEACHKTEYSSIQGALESGKTQSHILINWFKNI